MYNISALGLMRQRPAQQGPSNGSAAPVSALGGPHCGWEGTGSAAGAGRTWMAQGPGVCKLPKPPASRALCQAKRAPRAASPKRRRSSGRRWTGCSGRRGPRCGGVRLNTRSPGPQWLSHTAPDCCCQAWFPPEKSPGGAPLLFQHLDPSQPLSRTARAPKLREFLPSPAPGTGGALQAVLGFGLGEPSLQSPCPRGRRCEWAQ